MEDLSKERIKVLFASTLGNAFEWFDFTIFALLAVVIAKNFFPLTSKINSLLVALATMGAAFFFRPLGGILLGIYADKVGRKKVLSFIILLMAFGTALIAVTPNYFMLGITSSVLIVLGRIIQGFSAGGEFSSATSLLIEYAPYEKRGIYGSFQMSSQAFAVALGALTIYLLNNYLSIDSFESWGWRIPFLVGIFIGPIGFYIRHNIQESPEFSAYIKTKKNSSRSLFSTIWNKYRRQLFSGLGLTIITTASFYVSLIYLPIYAKVHLELDLTAISFTTAISGCLIFIICPLAGFLSDKIGRKPILLTAITLYSLTFYTLFIQLQNHPDALHFFILQICSAVLIGFFWGPFPATISETFPVEIRTTSVSIIYNIVVMLFGGLAPFFITYFFKLTENVYIPAYYILFTALVSGFIYGTLGRKNIN